MDEYKGLVKINYNSKEVGFKFGTMQTALFCKEMNCKLSELPTILDSDNLDAQLSWYHSACIAYSRLFKSEEISKDELAAIIDSYGYANLEAQASLGVSIPKEEAQ